MVSARLGGIVMSFSWTAIAAVVSVFCGAAQAQAPRTLTLDTAFERVIEKHPELARFKHLRESADAAVESEGLRAPVRVEFELENAPRSNQHSSLDSAEATLSLASILERGGKREARVAVADARRATLVTQEQQQRTDLFAEVARRYLDLLAYQSMEELAESDVAQRDKAVAAAAQRVRAGATPESVHFAAEGALARANLQKQRLRAQSTAAAARLALLWNTREPDFDRVSGNLLSVPVTPPLETLQSLINQSPELRRFADEVRISEARLQLARSQRATDLEWRAGVRRLEEDGSWAAVVGVSVPLGTANRAAPGIRSAQTELAALGLERESQAMALEATLVEAHYQLTAARNEVVACRDVLVPKLEQAARSSERAFRAGALTYTEWSQIQSEVVSARREQLLAALEAHRALIEIQRLTGLPFNTAVVSQRMEP
jgi:outer membrane protein, heavy metal efflux system